MSLLTSTGFFQLVKSAAPGEDTENGVAAGTMLTPLMTSTVGLIFAVGVLATAFLFWVRRGLKPLLVRAGLSDRTADLTAKAGPVAVIAATTGLAWALGWQAQIGLEDGLRDAYAWFLRHQVDARL